MPHGPAPSRPSRIRTNESQIQTDTAEAQSFWRPPGEPEVTGSILNTQGQYAAVERDTGRWVGKRFVGIKAEGKGPVHLDLAIQVDATREGDRRHILEIIEIEPFAKLIGRRTRQGAKRISRVTHQTVDNIVNAGVQRVRGQRQRGGVLCDVKVQTII